VGKVAGIKVTNLVHRFRMNGAIPPICFHGAYRVICT
jgi:hypothetical protein